ncbi:MAG: radical SAM protein [Anaerolineales bacterium]|jgi:putative pyruvate formate lyase activating enzyme
MQDFAPAYLSLHSQGLLIERARLARKHEQACDLCGRYCKVDRRKKLGGCYTGIHARIASFGPHHGEEDPLRGQRGSGTIFIGRCNLRCQYCQNADISQTDAGREVRSSEFAEIMLKLQAMGCHNINIVSPTHVIAEFLEALAIAAEAGLVLPIVYNTGGYDSPEALALLDGVIDIYMPDMKYAHVEHGKRYSKVPHYPEVNQAAVREMHRQVGDLQLDKQGIAQRGLLVRHLVLPEGLAGTKEIVKFLAEQISKNTYLNLMDQYRPAYKARQYSALSRPVNSEEYSQAVQWAIQAGLERLDSRRSRIFMNW